MLEALKFPSNAMAIIEPMIKFATFDIVPVERLDNEIYYWPETAPFSSNFEMVGYEYLYYLANIGFAMILIYMHVLLFMFHLATYKIKNCLSCFHRLHRKIGTYLYWAGLNRFFMELFFDLTFLSILNLITVDDYLSDFPSVTATNIIALLNLIFSGSILALYTISYARRPKNGSNRLKLFGLKFDPLLRGTKWQHTDSATKWYIIFIPVSFFSKRLLLVALLLATGGFVWL